MRRLRGALKRTFPGCVAQTEAIAFNMFLALAPTIVLVLGIVATSHGLRVGLLETIRPFRGILPPGLFQLVADYLDEPSPHPWQLILIGLAGSIVAGGQMMRLVIDGLRMVHKDRSAPRDWSRNLRALLLLAIAIAPWLITTLLLGLGRELRERVLGTERLPKLLAISWAGLYLLGALVIVVAVLAVIYHVGRPTGAGWAAVVRGAIVAAVLWWFASWAFAVYMRSVPYRAVFGELELAIGLMVWMELTATVILVGAAYNAECASSA